MKRRNFIKKTSLTVTTTILTLNLINVKGEAATYTKVGDCECGIESYGGCEEELQPGGGTKDICNGLKKVPGSDPIDVIIECKTGTDTIVKCR